ncbi:hypothetical protein [Photobacterium leiognathi]|uniref:hypothetical protein n=1 Tax=Photobacterium leiognathi TaxID=553611 RepID=UPI0029826872|nr:hypothetical protein [Photobacterium leiognathi]
MIVYSTENDLFNDIVRNGHDKVLGNTLNQDGVDLLYTVRESDVRYLVDCLGRDEQVCQSLLGDWIASGAVFKKTDIGYSYVHFKYLKKVDQTLCIKRS